MSKKKETKETKPKEGAVETVHPGAGVITPEFDQGRPQEPDRWTKKLSSVDEIIKYLKTAERYFCEEQDKWYGSEKRKTPA